MTVIDLVPYDSIRERAESAKTEPRHVFLRLLLAIPYLLGWLAAKAFTFGRFAFAAIVEGWEHGLSGSTGKGNQTS